MEGGPGESFETERLPPRKLLSRAIRASCRLRRRAISRRIIGPGGCCCLRDFTRTSAFRIRGITRESFLDHVLQAAENGLEIRLAWCLCVELIAVLETVIGSSRPAQIRPLLAQLPPGTRYEEVQIYMKCRGL